MRLLCAFLMLWTVAGLAQVATSRLEGTVQDATGAVIPGATVSAVNVKTDVGSTTTSNAQGLFVLPSLQPGMYTVTVEAQGFRKAVISNVELNVAGTVSQLVKLEVGSVADSITVEANAVRVQISESQISQAVTLRDIDTLPQLARGPMVLTVYQPGVQIDPGDSSYSHVNGLRQGSNNSTLDGIDVNDHVAPRLGASNTLINTDSVSEFRMVTSGGKAEYGRNAGGQVEMITRSGTNEWHGNVFDYHRNTVLNANDFFNNTQGAKSPARPKYIRNIFGGSLGGPLVRNRTFIFGNYQADRTRQEIITNRTVLTPEAKKGVFRWRPPGSAAVQSFDIARNDPRGLGIDRPMAELLKLVPDPNNNDVGDGLNTAGYRFNNPNNSLSDQYTIKVDHHFRNGPHAFFRWSQGRTSAMDSLNGYEATYPGQLPGMREGRPWGFSVGSDWVITSRIVNETRVGRQRPKTDWLKPARLPAPMVNPNSFVSPLATNYYQGRSTPVTEITDNLSIVRGKHTFKTGANLRFTTFWHKRDDYIWPNVYLSTGSGNAPPSNLGPAGSIIASADRQRFDNLYNDLLGRMSEVRVYYYSDLEKFQPAGTPRVHTLKHHEYGYFFQDDWRLRSNLTVNVGLRWEFLGVPFEIDQLQGVLDKAAMVNATGRFSDSKIQRGANWYKNDYNNFGPRIGLVWSPGAGGKTAIRAFYGLFYDRMIGATTSYADRNTPGFQQTVSVFPNAGGADARLAGGIPVGPQPPAPVLQLPPTRSTSIGLFDPNLRTAYVHNYSLSLQREIFRNTVVEAAYVGNRGVKLFMQVDYNQPRIYEDFLGAFRELQAYRLGRGTVSANNTLVRIFGSADRAISSIGASVVEQGRVGSAADTVDRNNYSRYAAAGVSDYYLRNGPQFNQLILGTHFGRSYYDSLQINVRRQTGALKVNANYTFSKSIDSISEEGNGFTNTVDNYNLRLNRGRGDTDRPHVFNSAIIYSLPIGQNRRLAGHAPRWLDTLIGGWDVGLLSVWESGGVRTISSGRASGPTTNSMSANYSGDRNIGSVMRRGDGVYYFTQEEKDRFSFAEAGSIGNSGRNAFRGPRYFNVDVSLVKRFRITERTSITYRAEAYNLLNNVNFGGLGASLLNPTSLGKLSSTVGSPRIMQMALRLEF